MEIIPFILKIENWKLRIPYLSTLLYNYPMNNIYRFSPIKDTETFEKVLNYITVELDKLSQKLLGESLPINTLKIFPHYLDEYDYLHKLIEPMGPKAPFNSETSLYVEVKKEIEGFTIDYLGVRVVDPYRLHVGCGDYEIKNFEEFKTKYLHTSPYIREIEGRDDMIEFWHPDFDVLGYVVPAL